MHRFSKFDAVRIVSLIRPINDRLLSSGQNPPRMPKIGQIGLVVRRMSRDRYPAERAVHE